MSGHSGKILFLNIALFLLAVAAAAPPPQINRSRSFGPDACGPADPSYIRSAEATGGLPMFLQRSEAAKAFHLVRESTKNNVVTVLWAKGSLESGSREIDVPVDSTMTSVTFALSVGAKGSTVSIRRPSGEEVVSGPASVEITELNCGRFVTVRTPEPGEWKLRLTGSGQYWLEAQATSEIFLVATEFVEVRGRIGHEGYFRIAGQPLAGQPATLRVNLSGPAEPPEFSLVSEAGEPIKNFKMKLDSHSRDDWEFFGELELPSQPFRVAVNGADPRGHRYQRFFAPRFHAQTVSVSHLGMQELPAGKTTTLQFTVHNTGEPSAFRIVVYDSKRFISRVEPRELDLGRGASGTVTVDFTIPAGTSDATGDTFSIVATSLTSTEISNSDVEEFSVVSPQ